MSSATIKALAISLLMKCILASKGSLHDLDCSLKKSVYLSNQWDPALFTTWHRTLNTPNGAENTSMMGDIPLEPYNPLHNQDLYLESNQLRLTKPDTFQNTSNVPGTRLIRPGPSSNANGYFHGYVFRGDSRSPRFIFTRGFLNQDDLLNESQINRVIGAEGGVTRTTGISTTVCAQVASTYTNWYFVSGYVYLIDAVNMGGFAIPTPRVNHYLVRQFPILRSLYEVNYMHSIPHTSIVGVVWPAHHRAPETSRRWIEHPIELKLAVNPEYEGGMEGAKDVVAKFNHGRFRRWWLRLSR
ncbi:MAG: hypothetical protein LPD71_02560 [Shewanella sp.]|nr:hypothetical protein [Shewanella sp.]MCF1437657.1 hypothetical protein [Shewanella sp.]MCF1456736.1 hypothetical protein [Shewanella sp.]